MLTHPTHGRLVTLGLTGMAKALDEQQRQPDIATLAFEERLALLVDREATERENKRLVSRLRFASHSQHGNLTAGQLLTGMDLPTWIDRFPESHHPYFARLSERPHVQGHCGATWHDTAQPKLP